MGMEMWFRKKENAPSLYSKLVQKGFYRFLTDLNISATLPPEFSKFRHLKLLDLSRNYFTGSIPQEWATTKLEVLSFMGNRLSGPFPKVFTYITSLRNLYAQILIFYPSIMKQLFRTHSSRCWKVDQFTEKLILSSNAFNGELPPELAKLVNLTDMRVSDNNFSGKIPDIISNWKQIQKLQIQGCSPLAPIPSSISALTSLSDLRISDLKGRGFPFPPLGNMDSLKTLIKSNCQMRDTEELLNTRRNSSIKWGHEEIEDSVSSTKKGLY
ncbi:PREDICTED: probable LRR receptor-like serine/threonine-protein kinase At1g07650 [Theobroma cacao]|uniref:Probable LRR receptor-like serine/threonine-protein kinase At1g07650 n=1 Tax=Theobroma cacao TaxID=3641 RepID=A0AB32W419_THECC|nr:PREDICTED: probable LRR receptor-like serine/threonine-protein kinase At1g07650 [Theobroma cacao]